MEAIPFRGSHTLMGKAISFRESPEAVARRSSIKKEFLEILQNSQENTCARVSFLIKLQASTPFFIEHLCWLFLYNVFQGKETLG